MLPLHYEQVLLGVIIKNNETNIPLRVTRELHISRFSEEESHKKIYAAINSLVEERKVPDPINIDIKLNSSSYGGIEYLTSLVNLPDVMNVSSNGSLESLVRKVDDNGRLNTLSKVLDKYAKLIEDKERLFSQVSDVDELYINLAKDMNVNQAPKTSYKPLKVAIDKELERFNREKKGELLNIIPCSMDALAVYRIPRPRSFGCILGIPSTGKTSLAIQLLIGAAKNLKDSGKPGKVYFHSLDTTDDNMARMIGCMLARIDSMDIGTERLSKEQAYRYQTCLDWAATLPFEYNDNLLTSDQMKKEAYWSSYECPRVLSVSDYAEKFLDKRKDSEELRMNHIITNHREVCWDTHSCEILLSQPGPESKNPTKILTLADARYSRSFEQNLDWGLVLWNPIAMTARNIYFECPPNRLRDRAYIFIQKNKGYSPGEIEYQWIPQYSAFREIQLPMNHLWSSEPWQMMEAEW